jgi:hypothetical protein
MPDSQPSYSIIRPNIVPVQFDDGHTINALVDSGAQRLNTGGETPVASTSTLSKKTVFISKELESASLPPPL